MDQINQSLLNDYQRDFPLVSRPFASLAKDFEIDSETLIERLRVLQNNGTISRVGPVFKANTIGVSTLAAISVPADQLEYYAGIVSSFAQVNHNYEREHEINLWFVVTAATTAELDACIADIETGTGCTVLVLPMLREYHIDLGFRMRHLNQGKHLSEQSLLKKLESENPVKQHEIAPARDLIAAIQAGLPLVEKPYQVIAQSLDWSESDVIEELKKLIISGAIKRFGVVVRHHEVGYRANAMVVWDVPDEEVDNLGQQLGEQSCVTLCYLRPRVLPRWPYNLFCMIHGQNRSEVMQCIDRICSENNLGQLPKQVLFSGQRFKQRGAHYRQNPTRAH